MRGYLLLLVSIIFEVAGSAFLKLTNGFTNLVPSILLIVCYAVSFTTFVFVLKTIPLSVGYSIWAGLGTAGAALVGILFFNEFLSSLNFFGLIVIISGVVLMNLNKKSDDAEKAPAT